MELIMSIHKTPKSKLIASASWLGVSNQSETAKLALKTAKTANDLDDAIKELKSAPAVNNQ